MSVYVYVYVSAHLDVCICVCLYVCDEDKRNTLKLGKSRRKDRIRGKEKDVEWRGESDTQQHTQHTHSSLNHPNLNPPKVSENHEVRRFGRDRFALIDA